MRFIHSLTLCVLLAFSGNLLAEEGATFEGPWRTTNRKLDGVMNCVVTPMGKEKWQGRFYGVWQGVEFDYMVTFTGPPDELKGSANIDGADYTWTGEITEKSPKTFKGSFGGNRYAGYFEMKERRAEKVKPANESGS
jgi:hypothetical protein